MSAESQNCEVSRELLLENGSINTPVVSHWLSSHHVIVAADTYATVEELLEALFSVQSMPGLYNTYQLPLQMSSETAVRKVRGWYEVVASLGASQLRDSLQADSELRVAVRSL
jgi:hypothetical protein